MKNDKPSPQGYLSSYGAIIGWGISTIYFSWLFISGFMAIPDSFETVDTVIFTVMSGLLAIMAAGAFSVAAGGLIGALVGWIQGWLLARFTGRFAYPEEIDKQKNTLLGMFGLGNFALLMIPLIASVGVRVQDWGEWLVALSVAGVAVYAINRYLALLSVYLRMNPPQKIKRKVKDSHRLADASDVMIDDELASRIQDDAPERAEENTRR
ncbi:MAG: hypothetical protein AAFN11_14550 [Chloroflexota bacterium]